MNFFFFIRKYIFIYILTIHIVGLYISTNIVQAKPITIFSSPTILKRSLPINKKLITDQSYTLQPINSIAAVVNDEIITNQELTDRFNLIIKHLTEQNIINVTTYKKLQHQLLEQMVIEKAQIQIAKQNGILINDDMLEHIIMHIAKHNNQSLMEFLAELKYEGIDLDTFKENIRQESILQHLRNQEINNKILVSEFEINDVFEEEHNNVNQYEEFNLTQILIRIPENTPSEKLIIYYQCAKKILNELKAGANFPKILRTYSHKNDIISENNLGWRTKNHLPQLFIDAILHLKPGEFSNIIQSDNGFHIIKLLDRRNTNPVQLNPITVPVTHVRHILIKINHKTSITQAKNKIQELKKYLRSKKITFEALAKLYSDDLSAKGGDLGWIYPGDTSSEFEYAMNHLKLGEISEPIESSVGFHLIQVLERKHDNTPQKWIRKKIHQAIREKKIATATQKWLKKIRNQTYVEYRINDI